MVAKSYWVYILASKSRRLYVGITNDLTRRVHEHKNSAFIGFTSKYQINRLVYFEEFSNPSDAISREKELKGWLRIRKIELIEEINPTWEDLFDGR